MPANKSPNPATKMMGLLVEGLFEDKEEDGEEDVDDEGDEEDEDDEEEAESATAMVLPVFSCSVDALLADAFSLLGFLGLLAVCSEPAFCPFSTLLSVCAVDLSLVALSLSIVETFHETEL